MRCTGKRSLAESAISSCRIVRFDAEFIERRFQLHREQMAAIAAELTTDIVIEVAAAVDQARHELAQKLTPGRNAA